MKKVTKRNGTGKALIEKITTDERYHGLLGILLTKDAHGFYKQYGFFEDAARCMLRIN